MKRLIVFVFMVGLLFAGGGFVAPMAAEAKVDPACKHSILGLPVWFEYLEVGPETLTDADGHTTTDKCAFKAIPPDTEFNWGRAFPRVALAVVDILLRVTGLISFGFVIFGGFRYILSQGEPDATKKAKGTIVGASVGLIIAMFAAGVVAFLGSVLWT